MASAFWVYVRTYIGAPLVLVTALLLHSAQAEEATALPDYVVAQFGSAPLVPNGPLPENLSSAVQIAFVDSLQKSGWGEDQTQALQVISGFKDPRLVWIISDIMRFVSSQDLNRLLGDAASELLGADLSDQNLWGAVTDHLIAWDIPAPPDYLQSKRAIFTTIVPGWEKLFVEGDID